MNSKTCTYLLSPLGQHPATYCGEPTKYTIALDDDRNKYRKHDHLCPKHRAIVSERETRGEHNDPE